MNGSSAALAFKVYDVATLQKVGTETGAGNWTLSAYYEQIANITLTSGSENFTRIGSGSGANAFTGIYNGGMVKNCSVSGAVTGTGENTGGVVAQNFTDTVRNCVALAPTVTGPIPIGRVTGGTGSTWNNNYARDDMDDPGAGKFAVSGYVAPGNANDKHGADVAAGSYNTLGWWNTAGNWTAAAWDTGVWDIANGRLPTLKNMPAGTQKPVVQ